MQEETIAKDLEALENLKTDFRLRARQKAAADTVENIVAQQKREARWIVAGHDFTPAEISEALEHEAREQFDAARRSEADTMRRLDRQIDRELYKLTTESETLPSESALIAPDALEQWRQQAAFTDATTETAARQRLTNLSAAEILALYRKADDIRDRALVRVIEEQIASAWRQIQVREEANHVEALTALSRERTARRQARVPASLRQLEERRRKVWDVTTDILTRHLLDGKGIGRTPRPRSVRIHA